MHGHTDFIIDIQTSPCGKYVVSTSNDSRAIVWDLFQAKKADVLEQHEASINNAKFAELLIRSSSRPGADQGAGSRKTITVLLTCSDDGKIILYDQEGFLHRQRV